MNDSVAVANMLLLEEKKIVVNIFDDGDLYTLIIETDMEKNRNEIYFVSYCGIIVFNSWIAASIMCVNIITM